MIDWLTEHAAILLICFCFLAFLLIYGRAERARKEDVDEQRDRS